MFGSILVFFVRWEKVMIISLLAAQGATSRDRGINRHAGLARVLETLGAPRINNSEQLVCQRYHLEKLGPEHFNLKTSPKDVIHQDPSRSRSLVGIFDPPFSSETRFVKRGFPHRDPSAAAQADEAAVGRGGRDDGLSSDDRHHQHHHD